MLLSTLFFRTLPIVLLHHYVISEFIMRGTHKGDFLGITPTNKVLEITGVDIDRVVDGKIVEHGGSTETFETFWTNGLIKPV